MWPALFLSLLFASLLTACDDVTRPPEQKDAPILWYYKDTGVNGMPYADDEIVAYNAEFSARVVALDARSGKLRWQRTLPIHPDLAWRGLPVGAAMVGHDGMILIAAWDVFALDRSTGQTRWMFDTSDDWPGATGVTLGGGRAYTAGRMLYALDPSTGRLLWSRDYDEQPFGLLYSDEVLYFSGRGIIPGTKDILGAGHVWAVSAVNGEVIWKRFIPDAPDTTWLGGVTGPGALTDDLLVVSSMNGRIYGLDRRTGEVRWEQQGRAPFMAGVAVTGNAAVTAGSASYVEAFDVRSGRKLWEYFVGGSMRYIHTVSGFALVPDGRATALDEHGNVVWEYGGVDRGQPGFSSPARFYKGRLYIGTVNGSEGGMDPGFYPPGIYALQTPFSSP